MTQLGLYKYLSIRYILLFIVVLIISLICMISWFYVSEDDAVKQGQLLDNISALVWNEHTYTHPRYNFSIILRTDYSVEQYPMGHASETDVLTEKYIQAGQENVREFQVFITPYGDEQITEARLQQDVRGGTISDMQEVMIGRDKHIRAGLFTSTNEQLGALREVWVIYHGFIYEFTTQLENDAWLADILNTLVFSY